MAAAMGHSKIAAMVKILEFLQIFQDFQKQWTTLMQLLDNLNFVHFDKLSGMRDLWILDSSCLNHMIDRKDFLRNLRSISPSTIGLPNGAEIVALHEGLRI